VGAVAVGVVAVVAALVLVAGVAPALGASDDSGTAANSDGSFTIDAVDVPSEIETGQDMTVTADITNTGDSSGERTVSFDVGGTTAETTVSLNAGATQTVSIDVTPPQERGDYDWTVDTGDDQASGTLSVIGPEIVLNEVIAPEQAEPGESVAFDMDITNVGERAGVVDISFSFDGEQIAAQEFRFEAGENSIVYVEEAMPQEPGTYSWTAQVGGETVSGEIEVIGPEFVVDDVSGPDSAAPGETVEFELDVRNAGELGGQQEVTFTLNGQEVGSRTFTLDSGERTTIVADAVVPQEPGTYEWTASAGQDSQSGEITVEGAEFVINDVSGPQNPEPGQTVEYEIDITNEGAAYGEKSVSFEFNGEEVGSGVFGFDAGENDIVVAEVMIPEDGGTYGWTAYAGEDTYSGETSVEGNDPAAFAFDSVNVPSSGDAGTTVTVDATVTNTGDQSGDTTVAFELAGERYDQTVSLDGGSSQTVSFDVSLPDSDGSYDWAMTSGSASESGSLDVIAQEDDAPAEFAVDSVDMPSSVTVDETVSVEATVTNTGDESGETTVSVDLGSERAETTVTLDGGETTTVTLSLAAPQDGGTYDWSLTTGDETETGEIEVSGDDSDDGDDGEEENDPAAFAFDSVNVPASGEAGETVTVEATVTNTGDEAGEATVVFYLGNDRTNTDISLDGGESQTVTFDVTLPDEGGNYGWSLSAGEASESGSLDVEGSDREPAAFEFDSVNVPASGEAGETVTVEATITNTGEESGETTVTFDLDGESYDQRLSLDGGATQTVTLSVTLPEESGEFVWSLDSGDETETGSLDVSGEDDGEDDGGDDGGEGTPEFVIENVDAPQEATTSDEVTVEATIKNDGENGEKAVSIWFAGDRVGEETVSLDGDEETTVSFDITMPDTSGTETWSVAADDETISGDITVVDQEEGPQFEIATVEAPQESKTGDEVSMTVEVTNVGGEEGSETIELVYDGEVVTSGSIRLRSGETDSATFDVTLPEDLGAQNWQFYLEEDEMSVVIEVGRSEPADIDIEDVNPPSVGETGEDVTVTTEVKNRGDDEGSSTFSFTLDGETLDTETVTLDGSEETTVEFDVTLPEEGGTYDWSVSSDEASQDGEMEVQETVKTAQLSVEDATVDVGEATTVEVSASGDGVTSYDVSVSFDPDVVNVAEVGDGDFGEVSVTIDEENGLIELSAAQESGVDDPLLAEITFETATTNDATTDLVFGDSPSLFDENVETFDTETEPGTLTVENTAQCQPGDVTGDGELTIADATLIQQYVSGEEIETSNFEAGCADMNDDGEVTTADVIAAMGQVTELN
jgi:acyl-CoA hydrolase